MENNEMNAAGTKHNSPQKASWNCKNNPNAPGCKTSISLRHSNNVSAEGDAYHETGELSDVGSESATQEMSTPAWVYILPIVGMLGAGYYAHTKGSNIGKILLYAGIGAWALTAPALIYTSKGIQDAVSGK